MISKQEIRAQNVETVTKAALELFYDKGIDNTTINDIAALAGVSKMSVFRYFDTKADIVITATKELFQTVIYKFKESGFADDKDSITGIQMVRNYLSVYPYLIDHYPQFLNYLCEVELFYSKNQITYDDKSNDGIMNQYWTKALERGMKDKTIILIEEYRSSHHTTYNIFKGLTLTMYLQSKDLSKEEIKKDLKQQTEHVIEMIMKYLMPCTNDYEVFNALHKLPDVRKEQNL